MNTPLNTTIYNEIEARLANITTANGYNNEFKRIERGTMKPFKSHDLVAVNFWASSVGNTNEKYTRDRRSIQVFFEVYDKTRDTPFMDICDLLAADLVTGLNRTILAPAVSDVESPELGELVNKFIFNGYDYQIGEGQSPWCGILARFTVDFLTTSNNMITI
jgi:hypothetical protein